MALVPIPTNRTLDGMSPVGELNTRQLINERALPRLQACANAFFAVFGIALVVVEGARSRPRQRLLRRAYEWFLRGGPWAPLAAPLYTSNHDEVTRGNAVDLGSNISKGGSAQSHWMRVNGPRFGVMPTGWDFVRREPWHYDILTSAFAGGGTPIEEDDMYDAAAEARLKAFIGAEITRAIAATDTRPRLYRNATTGEIMAADVEAGFVKVFTSMHDINVWVALNLLAPNAPQTMQQVDRDSYNGIKAEAAAAAKK